VSERIVAVGLLTQKHLDQPGPTLKQVWPIDGTPCFSGLLPALMSASARCGESAMLLQNDSSSCSSEPISALMALVARGATRPSRLVRNAVAAHGLVAQRSQP
jgi:hypothetical protein